MNLTVLDIIGEKMYKKQKLADGAAEIKDMLNKPRNFLLATRACDGCYYGVNSDIVIVLQKKKELIKKGIIGDVVTELSPDETIHGQRFVIFDPGKGEQAYLLGDAVTALKKLSEK